MLMDQINSSLKNDIIDSLPNILCGKIRCLMAKKIKDDEYFDLSIIDRIVLLLHLTKNDNNKSYVKSITLYLILLNSGQKRIP